MAQLLYLIAALQWGILAPLNIIKVRAIPLLPMSIHPSAASTPEPPTPTLEAALRGVPSIPFHPTSQCHLSRPATKTTPTLTPPPPSPPAFSRVPTDAEEHDQPLGAQLGS